MNIKEFKLKYPQHADLEGDVLWDMMELSLLESSNVLTADPNQKKVYHEPVILDNGISVQIEDSSTTRWLNKNGELVRIGEPPLPILSIPTESYRMDIIDFSEL